MELVLSSTNEIKERLNNDCILKRGMKPLISYQIKLYRASLKPVLTGVTLQLAGAAAALPCWSETVILASTAESLTEEEGGGDEESLCSAGSPE